MHPYTIFMASVYTIMHQTYVLLIATLTKMVSLGPEVAVEWNPSLNPKLTQVGTKERYVFSLEQSRNEVQQLL